MFPQRISLLYSQPESYNPPSAKELAENLHYPNLNVSDMNARLQNLTPRLHSCWDSLAMSDENHFALATNHRDGSQWWGSFFGFSQLNNMSVDTADYKYQAECLINALSYASNDTLLVALNDTRLQAWSTYSSVRCAENPYCLFLVGDVAAHNHPINQLNVFSTNKKRAVSTSTDNVINIWDLSNADLSSVYRARAAHSDKLTGLALSTSTDSNFITCDRGGCARLWDARSIVPKSTRLYNDETHMLSFTCAAWAAPNELNGENYVYLGDFDGNVHTLDIRTTGKLVETTSYFDEDRVSKILIKGCHLAVITDLPGSIKIENITGQRKLVYSKPHNHTRLTDAIWQDDNTLLTIGYGHKLERHKI